MSEFSPNLNESKLRQLVNEALHHQKFLIKMPMLVLDNDQLYGVITVNEIERNNMMEFFLNVKKIPQSNTTHSDGVKYVFMQPKKFLWGDIYDAFHYNLGYSIIEGDNCEVEENLSLALFLKNPKDHFPVGFIKFNINHMQFDTFIHFFHIKLESIHIDLDYKNTTYWLDLTCATSKFLGVLIESIIANCDDNDQFQFRINSEFTNEGGEKIGNLLLQKLNCLLNKLKINNPDKKWFTPIVCPEESLD
jgi:hypothetical protein